MRTSYSTLPTTHGDACRILEALCEGYVRAMVEEIDAAPPKTYPCCIKCGEFTTRNAPLTPAQAKSLEETIEHGHPVSGLQRMQLGEILEAHGYDYPAQPGTVRVGSVAEIVRNRGGHSVELACYQCAMKRHSGADPAATVVICCTIPGTYRGVVLMSDQHRDEHKRGRIDDPVVDARPGGSCGCGVPHAQ